MQKKSCLIIFIVLILGVFVNLLYFSEGNFFKNNGKEHENKIASGVILENVLLEEKLGKAPAKKELDNFVREYAREYEIEPEDAHINSATGEAVPQVEGKKLDLQKTLDDIYNASEGEVVKLKFKSVIPDKNLDDLPPAPIYRGNSKSKKVSFICNVAWGGEYINEFLEVLNENGVKISFFLEGRWASENPEKVKKIADLGHEIGNHGYSHFNMSTLEDELIVEEIKKTNETIESIIGFRTNLFGPPAGDYDERVVKKADELGMRTIMWSLDTIDWMKPGKEYMVEKIVNDVHPGAFILMHPTEATVEALEEILPGLKEKSYSIVPVSFQLEVSASEN